MSASTFAFTQLALAIHPILLPAERTRQVESLQLDFSDGLMHPGVIALALGGFALFLIASWVGWAFGYTALLIVVVCGLTPSPADKNRCAQSRSPMDMMRQS